MKVRRGITEGEVTTDTDQLTICWFVGAGLSDGVSTVTWLSVLTDRVYRVITSGVCHDNKEYYSSIIRILNQNVTVLKKNCNFYTLLVVDYVHDLHILIVKSSQCMVEATPELSNYLII